MPSPVNRLFLSCNNPCFGLLIRSLSSSFPKSKVFLNKQEGYEKLLIKYRTAVKEQANLVRSLKDGKTLVPKDLLLMEIANLDAKKQLLEQKEQELYPPIEPVNKAKLDDLLKQRCFYNPSFDIYGGSQGLYDLGPIGCTVQANIIQEWRKFFILEDHMLEVDCPVLTPESVLQASGHLAKFTDFLVSDTVTGKSYRADHLVREQLESLVDSRKTPEPRRQAAKEALDKLDSLGADGLENLIESFDIKAPNTGNKLTPPRPFNLMLETAVGGPDARTRLFLRPETAQGIFVNFRRLLNANNGRLPMAVGQVGRCFRNEIAPRSGLTRLREFTLAEIEHFYDPEDTSHPKFASVASLSIPLLSAVDQAAGIQRATWRRLDASLQAGAEGPVMRETLAYYLARIFLFLTRRCGIDPHRLRFRQHTPAEMAHYAADCWDAECLVTLGGLGSTATTTAWMECVGCADRAAYDLTQHAAASKLQHTAERRKRRPQQQQQEVEDVVHIDKELLSKTFNEDVGQVLSYLASLQPEKLLRLAREVSASGAAGLACLIHGQMRLLKPNMLRIVLPNTTESFVPCVVEPSFGIGRILSAALEHSFKSRQNDPTGGRRTFLSLSGCLAPYKCVLLPLINSSAAQASLISRLSSLLSEAGLAHCVDSSPGDNIGKRYARNDQIGVPYAVTVDHESQLATDDAGAAPPTVTLRERDSMRQVRVELDAVPNLIEHLVREKISWQQVMESFPVCEHSPGSKKD